MTPLPQSPTRRHLLRQSGWLSLAVLLGVAVVALTWTLAVLVPAIPGGELQARLAWADPTRALDNLGLALAVSAFAVLVVTAAVVRAAERRSYPELDLGAVEALVAVLAGAVVAVTIITAYLPVFVLH